jgi:hypothetical protein
LKIWRYTVVSLLLCSGALAQDYATLTVTVVDPTFLGVQNATLILTDLQRGTVNRAETNESGYFLFDFLQPGNYSLVVQKTGFSDYRLAQIPLGLRDRQALRVEMKLSSATGTRVEVTDRAEALSSDTAQGTTLEENYVQDLPINGRNAESLILMAPGVTSASGGQGGGADNGFNANGLRSTMNYFTLDGVSLNVPVGGGGGGGGFGGGFGGFGGGGGAGGGLGGGVATSLIVIDAMQEMKIQTSSFAPEFGRSPGAQVVMTSRGGTNSFHGSVYYYGRNTNFDANNWFANAAGLARGAEREDRLGGTFGGPILKNKTFFFVSLENLNLLSPNTVVAIVPDLASRQAVGATLAPFLNAYPVPNGPELGSGGALYQAVVTNPAKSHFGSLRLDHVLRAHTTLFARYSLTTSASQQNGSEALAPNIVTNQSTHSQFGTAGMTHIFASGAIDDLRVNYSESAVGSNSTMDTYGGAIPLTDSLVFPSGVTCGTGSFNLNLMGFSGYSYCNTSANSQKMVNVVDSLTRVVGNHHLKAGVDYRRMPQTNFRLPYTESASFNGIDVYSYAFITGLALNAQVSSNITEVYPVYMNYSMYGQDTWRATDRTTVTYGLRWDVNPAPTTTQGPKPFALSNDAIAGVTQNEPVYPTRWFNVAPRFGVSYLSDNRPGHEMVLRLGIGMFYDPGYGAIGGAFRGAPYSNVDTISEANFPLLPVFLAPPGLPVTRPYPQITTGAIGLSSPVVYQWNGTLEKNLGKGQVLDVSLVGSRGENLLRTETQPTYSSAYSLLLETDNGASSSYNGLQIQYRKRFSATFQTQLSYTWAHSIDSASSDAAANAGFATIFQGQTADSDYDIRQNLVWSGTFRLPSPNHGVLFAPLRHWYADFVYTAHTALPFDLEGVSTDTSCTASTTTSTNCSNNVGLFAEVRPDWNGLPVWISSPAAPGGRELNSAAFYVPTDFYGQGTLGRNTLRGFDFNQLDFAIRRVFPITERGQFSIALQGYNVLNHPNFANPSPLLGGNLASPDFGLSTQMAYQTAGGGINSLFRPGGPRSLELALRVQF